MLRKIDLMNPEYYKPETGLLDLSRQHLEDQDIIKTVIPFLKEHPEIFQLDLYKNLTKDEGAKALAACTTLTSLSLRTNLIGNEGAKALAVNKTLKTLDIRDNMITEIGIKALISNLNFEKLLVLYNDNATPEAIIVADETDPVKRTNYGREVGVASEVPTLKIQAMFKAKKENIDASKLTKDLIDEVKKPKA